MAGHSKWSNIKHRKGAQDAKRSKIFTKVIKEITVAAKSCPDPETNPRLRLAMDKAFRVNVPKDRVISAIKKAASKNNADDLSEIIYEGYALNGVALIIECLTDNKNRTVADVRSTLTKAGGSLATDGAVMYMFNRVGKIIIKTDTQYSEEDLLELAEDIGANDYKLLNHNCHYQLITNIKQLHNSVEKLQKIDGIDIEFAELVYTAENLIKIDDEELYTNLNKLHDSLEELDDVQAVWSNFE